MKTITAIIPSARRPGRFDVVADGADLATLSIEAIERLRLGVGTRLDEPQVEGIRREGEIVRVYDRALVMLAAHARAGAELRRLLVGKREEPAVVDAAIERLRGAGLIDDADFARQFARSKALGAGMSRRRLRQELGRRGVAADLGDDAIDEVFAEEAIDEEALVESAARKKLRTLTKLDPETRRRRLYAYLARRGYDADDVARVVRALVGREHDADAGTEHDADAGTEHDAGSG